MKKKILLTLLSFFTLSINLSAHSTSYKISFTKNSENNNNLKEHFGRNGELTEKEKHIAKIAWKYFENNYQPETGLVNAVNNYPSTTMWDIASYMAALVSVYELNIINKNDFDNRVSKLLRTFNKLDFFRGELPNKVYHTKTSAKVNYTNKPGEIGYSAIDLGRLLIWLKIIKERYPEHANAIDFFVLKWNFCNVLDKEGTMFGTALQKEKVIYNQEGRLGYEEYAAKGFELWGFNPEKALKPEPFDYISIYNIDIPYDTRDPRYFYAHNYVVSESYILDALELNWDTANDKEEKDKYHSDKFIYENAQKIYKVQEERFKQTGIITARSEHQLDSAPYFVYDTIFTDGYAWNTITDEGKYVPQFAAVSLKAALGLWVLWDTEYTDLIFDKIADMYDPSSGYYEGIYENGSGYINTFTSNNNGIMLEALLYKVKGKLLKFSNNEGVWEKYLKDKFSPLKDKCLPEK